jgi:hypothetical protein
MRGPRIRAARSLPPGFVVRRRHGALLAVDAELADAPEVLDLLEPGAFERLPGGGGAAGRAATHVLALRDGRRLVVRRVLHGGLLGPLLGSALLGARRPLAELWVTARLRARGAPVARPAFVLGERRAGPLWRAAVATYREEGAADALELLGAADDPARIERAAAAAGHAVRRFHDAGGRHRDLQVKNLLLRELPGGAECVIVDLDRARLLAAVTPRRRLAELMRLYRSLAKRGVLARVGRRGLAAFHAAYLDGDRELRRALRAHLPRERRRLALHAWRYGRS